jgi:hypothetical protein
MLNFAEQSMPTKLDDRFRHDESLDKILELKIIPLVTKSHLNLMWECVDCSSQSGIISRFDVRAKIKVFVEFRNDTADFFDP